MLHHCHTNDSRKINKIESINCQFGSMMMMISRKCMLMKWKVIYIEESWFNKKNYSLQIEHTRKLLSFTWFLAYLWRDAPNTLKFELNIRMHITGFCRVLCCVLCREDRAGQVLTDSCWESGADRSFWRSKHPEWDQILLGSRAVYQLQESSEFIFQISGLKSGFISTSTRLQQRVGSNLYCN